MVAPDIYYHMTSNFANEALSASSCSSSLVTTSTTQSHCEFFEFDEDELDTSDLQARVIDSVTTHRLLSSSNSPGRYTGPQTASSANSYGPFLHQHSNHYDDEATSLLASLTSLAPSVAKDFSPRPAQPLLNFPFRLIHEMDDLPGTEESYIAISYAWNTPYTTVNTMPRRMVSSLVNLPFGWIRTVEQFLLPMRKAIFMGVLEEMRIGEGLWFDQVCVDQSDEREKSVAIGEMGRIYGNARMTVVSLDDVAIGYDEAFWLYQYTASHMVGPSSVDLTTLNRGLYPPFMIQQPLFWKLLERILSSAWFGRAWCALEMSVSRKLVFLVPCQGREDEVCTLIRFTGEFFLHMLGLASELGTIPLPRQEQIISLIGALPTSTSTTPSSLPKIVVTKSTNRHTSPAGRGPVSNYTPHTRSGSVSSVNSIGSHKSVQTLTPFPSTLQPTSSSFIPTIAQIFRLSASGNPLLPSSLRLLDANRDKTSIALTISNIPLTLNPANRLQRPAIEDECLRKLLLVGLAARDPVSLCTTGTPLQLHDGSVSWLCRPTNFEVPAPKFENDKWDIKQGSDGRAEFIELDLTFLELPHRTQQNPLFPTQVQRARELIDLCAKFNIQSQHSLWKAWQHQGMMGPSHPRAASLRNIFIQTLACVFECGWMWILDVAGQVQQQSSLSMSPHGNQRNAMPLSMEPDVLKPLFDTQTPIQHSLQHTSTLSTLSSLLQVLATLISTGIPWASGASECSHGPLIVTSPSPSPFAAKAPTPAASPHTSFNHSHSRINTPNKAITFAPFSHSKTLLVAIPSAIKSSVYAPLARAWILTPSNPYTGGHGGGPPPHSGSGISSGLPGTGIGKVKTNVVSWVLRGKGAVFGEMGFLAAVEGGARESTGESTVVPRHRVFGPGPGA